MDKKQIEQLLEAILRGFVTPQKLPKMLYLDMFEQLEKSLIRGLDLPKIQELAPKRVLDTFLKMNRNLKEFAAAKTYQMVKELSQLDEIETLKSKFKLFYKTWFKTENDLVIKQSVTAQDWFLYQSQKDVLPLLRYVTAEDERVRHEHAELHGIIRPVDDVFWNEFMPANGYNCRCTVEQLPAGVSTRILPTELSRYRKDVNLMFRNNPAKTGYIFKSEGKDKHPYFKIPESDVKYVKELIS